MQACHMLTCQMLECHLALATWQECVRTDPSVQTLQERQLPLVLLLLQVLLLLLPVVGLLRAGLLWLLLTATRRQVPLLQLLQEDLAAVSAAAAAAAAAAPAVFVVAAVLAAAPPECARLGCKQPLQQDAARYYCQPLLMLLHPRTAAAAAAGVPSWQSGQWCQLLLEEARFPLDPDKTEQQQAHMQNVDASSPHTAHRSDTTHNRTTSKRHMWRS
jgi:hypothetical protein